MFFLYIHQPPAAPHSERMLDALPKVLSSSPASRVTTPKFCTFQEWDKSTVTTNRALLGLAGSVYSDREKQNLTQHLWAYNQASYSADMSPRALTVQPHQVLPSASLERLMSRWTPKGSPRFLSHFLSNPGGHQSLPEMLNGKILFQSFESRLYTVIAA